MDLEFGISISEQFRLGRSIIGGVPILAILPGIAVGRAARRVGRRAVGDIV
jgi:hypothetical protein